MAVLNVVAVAPEGCIGVQGNPNLLVPPLKRSSVLHDFCRMWARGVLSEQGHLQLRPAEAQQDRSTWWTIRMETVRGDVLWWTRGRLCCRLVTFALYELCLENACAKAQVTAVYPTRRGFRIEAQAGGEDFSGNILGEPQPMVALGVVDLCALEMVQDLCAQDIVNEGAAPGACAVGVGAALAPSLFLVL